MKQLIARLNYLVWTAEITRFVGHRSSMISALDLACGNGEFLIGLKKRLSLSQAEGWDLCPPLKNSGIVNHKMVDFLKPLETQVDMAAFNFNLITFMNSMYVLRDLSHLERFLRACDFDLFIFSIPNETALRVFEDNNTTGFENSIHDIGDFMANAGLKQISKVNCVPAYYLKQPVRTVLFGLADFISVWAERRAHQKYYELYFCEKSDGFLQIN